MLQIVFVHELPNCLPCSLLSPQKYKQTYVRLQVHETGTPHPPPAWPFGQAEPLPCAPQHQPQTPSTKPGLSGLFKWPTGSSQARIANHKVGGKVPQGADQFQQQQQQQPQSQQHHEERGADPANTHAQDSKAGESQPSSKQPGRKVCLIYTRSVCSRVFTLLFNLVLSATLRHARLFRNKHCDSRKKHVQVLD